MTDYKEKLEKLQHEVTDNIVADLKRYESEGEAPAWIKPWRSGGGNRLPQNLDGRYYSGINVLILLQTRESKGYSSNRWGTFKAIKDRGGRVLCDESATQVFFYKSHFVKKRNEDVLVNGDEKDSDDGSRILLLRYYNLFNLCQTTIDTDESPEEISEEKKFPELSDLVNSTKAMIGHGFSKASYTPSSDRIKMPELSQFKTEEDYWATLLHEMVHWTGHESRLNRYKKFSYPTEELIAELGASFLCAEFNVNGCLQHSEYIHSWIKEMQGNCKHIFKVAAQASQAHRMLKELHSETSSDEVSAA
jgi:antirestriction protein ArdC